MKYLKLYILLFGVIVACKSPEARVPVTAQSGTFLKASAERNIKLNAYEEEQIRALIKTKEDQNFIASESGFWYHYNKQLIKDTIQPEFGDELNYDYSVYSLDGKQIYSETDLGNQTYLMDKEELFTGLREGLKLMKPTEEITFIFPSQKAYGYYGDEQKIGANTPLICNVTLNSILKNND